MGFYRQLNLAFLLTHDLISHLTFRNYTFKKFNIWIKMNAQSSCSDHQHPWKINELVSAM